MLLYALRRSPLTLRLLSVGDGAPSIEIEVCLVLKEGCVSENEVLAWDVQLNLCGGVLGT